MVDVAFVVEVDWSIVDVASRGVLVDADVDVDSPLLEVLSPEVDVDSAVVDASDVEVDAAVSHVEAWVVSLGSVDVLVTRRAWKC